MIFRPPDRATLKLTEWYCQWCSAAVFDCGHVQRTPGPSDSDAVIADQGQI